MKKKNSIKRYTADELKRKQAVEGTQSDWHAASEMTADEIEAAIADDADEGAMVIDWSNVDIHAPEPKAVLNMRVDRDVLEFFKNSGRGYQTRINAVLKAYKDAHCSPTGKNRE